MSAKYLGEPACADTLSRANTRVAEFAFRRVSFVLNGVATPSELAGDRTVTPFNIGESVSLSDFTIDEAESLASGFRSADRNTSPTHAWSEAAVDDVVTSLFRGPRDEPNLAFVDSMLTARLARGHSAADVVVA